MSLSLLLGCHIIMLFLSAGCKSVHLLRSMARREGQAEFFSHHVSLHMGPKDKDLTLIPQVVEWLKHFILFRCTWVQLPVGLHHQKKFVRTLSFIWSRLCEEEAANITIF